MKKVYSKKIFEAKNYGMLYHILDLEKLKYVFENNHFKTYKAANGSHISFTRNKMMSGYLGDGATSFFKLEIDGEKLSNNYKIKPFSYISRTNVRFTEWEEIAKTRQGVIKDVDKYITKLIIIKHKVDDLMEVKPWSRGNNPSDYFTTAGTGAIIGKGTMPEIFKYVVENSPYDIYVQDGSVIKKDDEYIQSIINYKLIEIEFKYDVWYRGQVKHDRSMFGTTDGLIDSDGNIHKNWAIGNTFQNVNLKDREEIDLDAKAKDFEGEDFENDRKYKPYVMKFRKVDDGYYLEEARPIDWVKPEQFFESLNESHVSNKELIKHHLNQMIRSIQKKSKTKIKSDQVDKDVGTTRFDLKVRNVVDHVIFEKVLKAHQKKLLDYGIVLGYSTGGGYDIKMGDSLDDMKSVPNNTKDFHIYTKSLHTKRVKPPRYVYHFSHKDNRELIFRDGILPKDFKDSKRWNNEPYLAYPPAVFVTTDRSTMWHHDEWKIDTTGLDNIWWQDVNLYKPNQDTQALMTFDKIPSINITLVTKY